MHLFALLLALGWLDMHLPALLLALALRRLGVHVPAVPGATLVKGDIVWPYPCQSQSPQSFVWRNFDQLCSNCHLLMQCLSRDGRICVWPHKTPLYFRSC